MLDRIFHRLEDVLARRPILAAALISIVGLGAAAQLWLAAMARHPGHADPSFYYDVAENLVDGRGFQIDYVWQFLSGAEAIPHYSNDYWMPLASVIIAGSMLVLGKFLFAALLPGIAAGLGLTVLTYFVARLYSGTRLVALGSAVLVLFARPFFQHAVITDTTIYFALLASSSLYFMIRGRERPALFLLAAALVALAHLTRQDGVFLVPTLGLSILLCPVPLRRRIALAALAAGIYLLIMSPLLVANCRVYGALTPPGPGKTFFMTEYEDLYSYSKELSLRTYLGWGLLHIVYSKLQMAAANARTLFVFLGGLVPIFALGGAVEAFTSKDERSRRHLYVPPIFLLAVLLVFYSLVATVLPAKGGLVRSLVAVAPFIVVMAVVALDRHVGSRAIFLTALLVTTVGFAGDSLRSTRTLMTSNAHLGQELVAAGRIIGDDARTQGASGVVVMTREPWELFHTTRYKAVQIPYEDREVICQVAGRYSANYLLLPAPRKALDLLYAEEETDPRFPLVARVPHSNLKVFRIRCGT